MRILLVDDDIELCELLRRFFHSEGIEADYVHDGNAGMARACSGDFDLAVLDIMMPGKNGMDVLREIRQQSNLPVIMLTARGEDMDRIIGLELGADEYLPKPCNPRELTARIRAVLRRTESTSHIDQMPKVIRVGLIEWHQQSHTVFVQGKQVELTSTEYNILVVLIKHAGKVVTKRALSEAALGKRFGPFDRSLDVHIGHIRKKLLPLPDSMPCIKTIRSVGWLLISESCATGQDASDKNVAK